MVKGFGMLDYFVVIGYFIAIATIGGMFYRREDTAKNYFLAGRSMSWLPVGISILAADFSAITVMGIPAWAYKHNLQLLLVVFGYPLMAPVVIMVFLPFYAKLKLYTAYEYLERRFNLRVRLATSVLFQLLRGSHVAIAIYAPSLVISLITGLPVWRCIIFMGLISTVCSTLGGMKAVIWTNVIQFLMVMMAMSLVFYAAISHIDGGTITAFRTALDAGKLSVLNFSTDPKQLTSVWACLLGGLVLCMAPLTTDQTILQRLFTTKSHRDCRQSVILQAALVIPACLLLYLAGTALFVFYHFHTDHLAGLNSDDAILPFFAIRELPHGVSGLLIASIFAASMAVMSAGISALTTASTVDIYQRLFHPNETVQHYAIVGRIGTICWGLAATFLALFAKHLGELVNAYNRVSSYISGPLLGIFLLGILTRRTTAGGSLLGATAGFFLVSWVGLQSHWSFFYLPVIGLATTVTVGYAASLLMQPPPAEQIRGLVMGLEVGENVEIGQR